jgi:predicted HD phosphohydrolase
MAFDRRAFLRNISGGAALVAAGRAAQARKVDPPVITTAPSAAWVFRYAINPDAPRLKPPIDLIDIIESRLGYPHPEFIDLKTDTMKGTLDLDQANHSYQAAEHAMKKGYSDDVITAALCHDLGKAVSYEKHCYFSAEMVKPYVSEKIYWIIKNHFDVGYAMYPDLQKVPVKQRWLFTDNNHDRIGLDPAALKRNQYYLECTRVRDSDDSGRKRSYRPKIQDELRKVLAKTFKLSKQGLGYDGASSDELWKLMIEPAWLS